VLLSGDHKKIEQWRQQRGEELTRASEGQRPEARGQK
jgi:tRNA G37 N-methylase TrmD